MAYEAKDMSGDGESEWDGGEGWAWSHFCLPAVIPQTPVQVREVEQGRQHRLTCCAKTRQAGSGATLRSLSDSLCSFRWDCKTRQVDLDKATVSKDQH